MESVSDIIFDLLIDEYRNSDVCSGELIYSVKIPLLYDEDEVRCGIQMFLDWDESEEIFGLKKNRKYWKIFAL